MPFKNKEAFHDVCKSLSEQGIELNKSFESKTGSAIKETLNKHLNQIRNEMISKQYDLINSCGKNKNFYYYFNLYVLEKVPLCRTFSNTRIDAILSSIAPASILCSFNFLKAKSTTS